MSAQNACSKNAKMLQLVRFLALKLTSQASDVGSIPIARSRNPIDSNTLTGLKPSKTAYYGLEVGRSWTRSCTKLRQLDANIRPICSSARLRDATPGGNHSPNTAASHQFSRAKVVSIDQK